MRRRDDNMGRPVEPEAGSTLLASVLILGVAASVAFVSFTLTSAESRKAARETARFENFYQADGALRVTAQKISRLSEESRPATAVTLTVADRRIAVNPTGKGAWSLTISTGEGASRVSLSATLRESGGKWTLRGFQAARNSD